MIFQKPATGSTLPLDIDTFRYLFSKKIVYVMAFVSKFADGISIINNMSEIGLNITKFSLIQSIREMNTERNVLLVNEISRE